ncbi:putative Protein LST8 like protein [Blattamonas nauphoetae]|uniref:WD_REPEATS_REGION domain-containing protein n=1 Tax=Blattamonas nauphoetae TaxID=2049346 RepID=A0ABQ9YFM0_9EUKA|nr:putative Protein LST8 like protein [Blattamonas nauphoetae]
MNDVLVVVGGSDKSIDHANCITFASDKQYFLVGAYKAFFIYRRDHREHLLKWPVHDGNVVSIISLPKDRIATGSEDKRIIVWTLKLHPLSKPERTAFRQFTNEITSLETHPLMDSLLFASFQNGEIIAWNFETDTVVQLRHEGSTIRSLSACRNNNFLFAATNDGSCEVYHLTTFQKATEWQAHVAAINKCLLSPDGTLLATCSSDHTARVWDVTPLNKIVEVAKAAETAEPPPTSPSSPPTKPSSNLPTVKWKHSLQHSRWVWDCAFSSDAKILITVSSDRLVQLWTEHSPNPVTLLERQKSAFCVALSEYK